MEYEKLRTYLRACADCEILNIFKALDVNNIIYLHGEQFKNKPIGFGLNKEQNTFCIYDIDMENYKETLKNEIPLNNLINVKIDPENIFITYSETRTVYKYNEQIYR